VRIREAKRALYNGQTVIGTLRKKEIALTGPGALEPFTYAQQLEMLEHAETLEAPRSAPKKHKAWCSVWNPSETAV
jgi:hypothetical protein